MISRSIFGCIMPRLAHRCFFSVDAARSCSIEASVSPSLPSREFLKNSVCTVIEKDKLASIVSEIEMYKEFHGRESIPELTDQQWASLMTIKYPDERCNFLAALHFDNEKRGREKKKEISAFNQEPYEYNLFDIQGQEFRRQMDVVYGSRLWSGQRCESDLPRLIVDARFLSEYSAKVQPIFTRSVQELHDLNWSSANPFSISIANFRPDTQLAELIKRHWIFLHGPPAESANASSFRVHPFSPTVSPRPVRSLLNGVHAEDIVYISQKAHQFLPEKAPANIKAVVLCLSNDAHPHTSSKSAAVAEGLTSYRIPIEKYINMSNSMTSRSPPIWEMAETLRGWLRGEEWRNTIRQNIVVRRKRMKTLAQGTTSHTFLAFRSAVMDMKNEVLERKRKEETREEERRKREEERAGWKRNEKKRRFNL